MSENTKSSKEAHSAKPDLATPLHNTMSFWRSEVDRFAREYDSATEHSVREMRRYLDESHRLLAAQLDAQRQATAIATDAVRRLSEVGARA